MTRDFGVPSFFCLYLNKKRFASMARTCTPVFKLWRTVDTATWLRLDDSARGRCDMTLSSWRSIPCWIGTSAMSRQYNYYVKMSLLQSYCARILFSCVFRLNNRSAAVYSSFARSLPLVISWIFFRGPLQDHTNHDTFSDFVSNPVGRPYSPSLY